MSFAELKKSDYSQKTKEFVIEHSGKSFKFKAKELSFLQRLNLAAVQQGGGDTFTNLVVQSIVDEDGKHMTVDQAVSLPEEVQLKFFEMASEVNKSDAEKN